MYFIFFLHSKNSKMWFFFFPRLKNYSVSEFFFSLFFFFLFLSCIDCLQAFIAIFVLRPLNIARDIRWSFRFYHSTIVINRHKWQEWLFGDISKIWKNDRKDRWGTYRTLKVWKNKGNTSYVSNKAGQYLETWYVFRFWVAVFLQVTDNPKDLKTNATEFESFCLWYSFFSKSLINLNWFPFKFLSHIMQ